MRLAIGSVDVCLFTLACLNLCRSRCEECGLAIQINDEHQQTLVGQINE